MNACSEETAARAGPGRSDAAAHEQQSFLVTRDIDQPAIAFASAHRTKRDAASAGQERRAQVRSMHKIWDARLR